MTQSHVPLCLFAHGVTVAGKQWSGVCVHACDIGKECTVDGGVGGGFCASSTSPPHLRLRLVPPRTAPDVGISDIHNTPNTQPRLLL